VRRLQSGQETLEVPPSDNAQLSNCVPVYEEHEGWQKPTDGCRTWRDLPKKAQAYVKRLAELSGGKLGIVSVGPNRDQTIVV
jgi:adenylosuccinate synthase